MFDTLINSQAAALGVPSRALKVVIMLLLCYPGAILFRLVPRSSANLRHLYSIFFSAFLYCGMFNISGFVEMTAMALLVYSLTRFYGNKPWNPFLVFGLSMTYLARNHFASHILFSDDDRFDNTAPIMVLVIKLTSFAWSSFDAHRPREKLSKDELTRVIMRFPGLLEYLGYVFFFPAFLVGPSFEFRDYQMFIHNEAPFDNIPAPWVPTLQSFLLSLFTMVIYILYGSRYSYEFTTTDSFVKTYSFWQR